MWKLFFSPLQTFRSSTIRIRDYVLASKQNGKSAEFGHDLMRIGGEFSLFNGITLRFSIHGIGKNAAAVAITATEFNTSGFENFNPISYFSTAVGAEEALAKWEEKSLEIIGVNLLHPQQLSIKYTREGKHVEENVIVNLSWRFSASKS